MLKALGLKMLFTAIRLVISKALFEKIYELVVSATSLQVSGPEKKALVLTQIKAIKGDLSTSVKSLPNLLLSMAIDVAYTEFNVVLGKI